MRSGQLYALFQGKEKTPHSRPGVFLLVLVVVLTVLTAKECLLEGSTVALGLNLFSLVLCAVVVGLYVLGLALVAVAQGHGLLG